LKAKLYTLLASILTILIAYGSLYSGEQNVLKHVLISDKVIHAFSYLILTLSWLIVFNEKLKNKTQVLLLAIVIVTYGIILEVFQEILTNVRTAEFGDIIANSVGVLIAVLIFTIFKNKRMLIK